MPYCIQYRVRMAHLELFSFRRSDLTFILWTPPCTPSPKLNLIRVLAKLFFRSTSFLTSVAVECIWTACFVILSLSRSFTLELLPGALVLTKNADDMLSLVLSLFSLGVGTEIKGTGAQMPFLVVEICCWALTGLSKYRTPKILIECYRMDP